MLHFRRAALFDSDMHQVVCQTHWGSLQRAPRPPSVFRGPTSKERGGKRRRGGSIRLFLDYVNGFLFSISDYVYVGIVWYCVFSLLHAYQPLKMKQVCVQPRSSAHDMTLPAAVVERGRLQWISTDNWHSAHAALDRPAPALSSKPDARRC